MYPTKAIADVIRKEGVRIAISSPQDKAEGRYWPLTKRIDLQPYLKADEHTLLVVLLHEYAHHILHGDIVIAGLASGVEGLPVVRQLEIEAQICAIFSLYLLGINPRGADLSYVYAHLSKAAKLPLNRIIDNCRFFLLTFANKFVNLCCIKLDEDMVTFKIREMLGHV